jgi:ribosome recycling factor
MIVMGNESNHRWAMGDDGRPAASSQQTSLLPTCTVVVVDVPLSITVLNSSNQSKFIYTVPTLFIMLQNVLSIILLAVTTSAFVSGPSVAHYCRPTAPWTTTAVTKTATAATTAARGPLFLSTIKEITSDAETRMVKSVDSVKQTLTTVRTGRASASMLDRIKVSYYGVETPLNQMASISVPSAQQLAIDPYDKTATGDIEKAISESDLGLTANNDGTMIRINIPALTEDRRKEMLKQCKALGEEGKVAVRNVRRDGVDSIKKLEKGGDVGEDEMLDGLDVIKKMTDKSVKDIDDIVARKEKEVMTV